MALKSFLSTNALRHHLMQTSIKVVILDTKYSWPTVILWGVHRERERDIFQVNALFGNYFYVFDNST